MKRFKIKANRVENYVSIYYIIAKNEIEAQEAVTTGNYLPKINEITNSEVEIIHWEYIGEVD